MPLLPGNTVPSSMSVPDYLVLSYKEILASKYSVPAMAYRLNKGFLDEDIVMCVGCMAMIQAEAAGVMYSIDPGDRTETGDHHQRRLGTGQIRGRWKPDTRPVYR